MKNSLLIILILSFSIFAQETIVEAYTKDAEKLVLKKDKAYIIPTKQGKSFFELDITENGYSVGEMNEKGQIWSAIKIGKEIRISTTKYEKNKRISLMDTNGDGLPNYRLTMLTDKDGKIDYSKVTKEKITYKFEKE